jgi:hypothetical protein
MKKRVTNNTSVYHRLLFNVNHCWGCMQRISNKNSQNRQNRKMNHITGSKGFSQFSYEKVKCFVTRFSFTLFNLV